jgi:hypothetical protein
MHRWTKFCPKHFSIKASGRLIDWLASFLTRNGYIYVMVSFSGGVVGVKHRPTASNWQTLPYKIRTTMHHSSNLLEKKFTTTPFCFKKQIPMKIKWFVPWKLGAEIMIEKRHTLWRPVLILCDIVCQLLVEGPKGNWNKFFFGIGRRVK